jgi:hypothetical protein
MADYDAPLPPIEGMGIEQLKAEVFKLRGDKTGRRTTKAKTTKAKNIKDDYNSQANLLKALPDEERIVYANKLGMTLPELDEMLKEA